MFVAASIREDWLTKGKGKWLGPAVRCFGMAKSKQLTRLEPWHHDLIDWWIANRRLAVRRLIASVSALSGSASSSTRRSFTRSSSGGRRGCRAGWRSRSGSGDSGPEGVMRAVLASEIRGPAAPIECYCASPAAASATTLLAAGLLSMISCSRAAQTSRAWRFSAS